MSPQPRAFDPSRLWRALRLHVRVLLGVTAVALFGGAVVGRLAVPNLQVARATARIARDPHAVVARALDDDVLELARSRSQSSSSLASLREQIRIRFSGHDRLDVEVRVGGEVDRASARRVADALVEDYVALANTRSDQQSVDGRRRLGSELDLARAENERAQTALAVALAREGVPELGRQLNDLRAAVARIEADAQAASADASGSQERVLALHDLARQRAPQRAQQELANAQRELSRALAQSDEDPARVAALRTRIKQLQSQTAEFSGSAINEEVEARAQRARARELDLQLVDKRAGLARLQEVSARVAPLSALSERASQHLAELTARAAHSQALSQGVATAAPAVSRVSSRAELGVIERRGLRLLVSLLAPLIALLTLAAYYALRELRGLRVCAATELAHWMGVPVLTSSSWPRNPQALESLVDELADPALDALGTTLVLPLTELERPLAVTLAAQLNARAQRHYRSLTGSRVTIAQNWQGELDSSRIKRAAEVADRVLWVVAADAHRGEVLTSRRALVVRTERVGAVLVDAEPGIVRSVGSTDQFWVTRPSELGAELVPARVPLH